MKLAIKTSFFAALAAISASSVTPAELTMNGDVSAG